MSKEAKIFSVFILIAAVYILCKISFLNGVLKERESKVCVGDWEINQYEQTLNTASIVCIGVQNYKAQELNECRADIDKWKNNYNWLKKQQAATTTAQNL